MSGGERLRIGLLSLAHVHAATYASLLSGRHDVELLVADPDGYGTVPGPAVFDNYDDVFGRQPHAVIVCSETARHRPLVERAAAQGAAVLCEKPLATNLADAGAMIDACRAGGIMLMTAYPVRFHPAFRAMVATIRSGRLGRVLAATGTNNGRAPLAGRPWFVDAELAGGGAVMDHTVHLADLLDELLGVPPTEVYATTNQVIHRHEVAVETGGLVAVTYRDGTVATIDCSWSAPASYPAWGGLTLSVQCEGGSVHFDAFAHRLDHFDDAAGGLRWIDYGLDLDALMLHAFIEGVRSGAAVQPDGEVGYRTLAVVAAAYESAASGVVHPVEPPR